MTSRRGFRDPETGEIREQPWIINCMWPPHQVTAWYCAKGHAAMRMELFPADKREPAQYWECVSCKRRISIDRRDKTFQDKKQDLMEIYSLRVLEYEHNNDTWSMESSEWQEDRLTGKIKPIPAGLRKEIEEKFITELEKEIAIELESMRDYFIS